MKRFMKLMAAMLGAVMVLSSLAACTTPAPTTAPTTAPTAAPTKAPTVSPTDVPTDAPTEEPTEATGIPPKYGKKVREKGVITVGVPRNSGVEDYETNDWTLWLEEVTGLDIQFEYFSSAAADYRSQLATRIADFQHEELPDILWGFNLTESTIHDYGEDGFLFDLAPYYEDKEKSKDFWDQLAIMDEPFQEEIIRKLKDVDTGAMYATARIEYALIDPIDYQVYINTSWLEKLNLKAPTTLDELHDVLVAFKTQDPNGNGLMDEIPIAGIAGGTSANDLISWILNFFEYVDDSTKWNADDNQNIYSPYLTDKYREGLITLNKWYSEGLLYQSMYAAKSKDLKALMNPTDGVETVGIIVDHSSLTYIDGAETMYDYDPLPLLGYAVHNAQAFNKRCYITTDCQYPDDAWRLLMAMNSDEGSKRGYYGVKGRDWDDADPGQKSALGMDAEIKIINYVWGNNKNELWNQVNFILFYSENEKTQIAGGEDAWGNVRVRKMADFYYAFEAAAEKNNPKYVVHSLIYSTEEKEKTADIRSNCSDAITTAQTSFITGDDQKDPANDADWQEYLNLLKSLGMDTWRDQAQRLYDAQQRK